MINVTVWSFLNDEKKSKQPGELPLYLLEGSRRPLRQTALHQVVSQLPEVKQLFSVVLHRSRHQLSLQANCEHRLHLHMLITLDRESHTHANKHTSSSFKCVWSSWMRMQTVPRPVEGALPQTERESSESGGGSERENNSLATLVLTYFYYSLDIWIFCETFDYMSLCFRWAFSIMITLSPCWYTLEMLEERLACRIWKSCSSALWDRCSETPLSDRWL